MHKIENFVKSILLQANTLISEGQISEDSIEEYYKVNYNKFTFKEWKKDPVIGKINWICNSVKHTDGYPCEDKHFPPSNTYSKDEKIKLSIQEFKSDIDYVTETYYRFKLSQIMTLALFKKFKTDFEESDMENELKEKVLEMEENIKNLMNF